MITKYVHAGIYTTLLALLAACGGGDGARTVQSSLPRCGSDNALFSAAPIAVEDLWGVVPLGNLNPPSHTFPTRHMYLYSADPANPPPTQADVYSPGDVKLVRVDRVTYHDRDYGTGVGNALDYSLTFAACREVSGYYNHLLALDAGLLDQIDFSDAACETYSTADESVTSCTAEVNVSLAAGLRIGKASYYGTLDVGLDDTRIELGFINRSQHRHFLTAGCFFDYYAEPLKSQLMATLGQWDGSRARTTSPVCGSIDYDRSGTAQGLWIHASRPSGEFVEGWGLALAWHMVDGDDVAVSWGNMGGALDPGGVIQFRPAGSGLVNRRFDEITADGQVYCADGSGQSWLFRLDSTSRLTAELRSGTGCGAGPFALGANAMTFVR